jgi:hypothetical protein
MWLTGEYTRYEGSCNSVCALPRTSLPVGFHHFQMQGTRDQELASHCRDRIHCSNQIRTWETLASWYVNWPTCIKSSIDPEYVAPAVYHRGRGLIMVELEYPQIWPGERARHTGTKIDPLRRMANFAHAAPQIPWNQMRLMFLK